MMQVIQRGVDKTVDVYRQVAHKVVQRVRPAIQQAPRPDNTTGPGCGCERPGKREALIWINCAYPGLESRVWSLEKVLVPGDSGLMDVPS